MNRFLQNLYYKLPYPNTNKGGYRRPGKNRKCLAGGGVSGGGGGRGGGGSKSGSGGGGGGGGDNGGGAGQSCYPLQAFCNSFNSLHLETHFSRI